MAGGLAHAWDSFERVVVCGAASVPREVFAADFRTDPWALRCGECAAQRRPDCRVTIEPALWRAIVELAEDELGHPLAVTGHDERRRVVQVLARIGVLELRNAVALIASALQVSRYTVYGDLAAIESRPRPALARRAVRTADADRRFDRGQ